MQHERTLWNMQHPVGLVVWADYTLDCMLSLAGMGSFTKAGWLFVGMGRGQ